MNYTRGRKWKNDVFSFFIPKNSPVNCQDELKQNNIDVLSLSLSNKFPVPWKSRLRVQKKKASPRDSA